MKTYRTIPSLLQRILDQLILLNLKIDKQSVCITELKCELADKKND